MTNQLVPINDLKVMAEYFVKSKLFGIQNVDQAMALFFVAQSEGVHPAVAARDYHIISGRPALKADAMLARFQQAGGKVNWNKLTDDVAEAVFSHPSGGSATINWDKARAAQAQLGGNGMWAKYPRQMLRARVISEGIRTVYPAVIVGSYTPEEIADFDGITIEHQKEPPKQVTQKTIDVVVETKAAEWSVEAKKKLYADAWEAIEKVSDESEFNVWTSTWYVQLEKVLHPDRLKEFSDKSNSIMSNLQNKAA